MADQGKWFKLWCSALTDAKLEDLELNNWARWVRFGAWLKQQGKAGKVEIENPATALKNLFRLPDIEAVITCIKLFPNCSCEEIKISPLNETGQTCFKYIVKFKNWNKYQGDYSYERVKKYRVNETAKETAQEEKRREENKKRRDIPPNPQTNLVPPTPEEATSYARSLGFILDGQQFCAHYGAANWMRGKTKIKDWRQCVVTWKPGCRSLPAPSAKIHEPPPVEISDEDRADILKTISETKSKLKQIQK